MWRVGTTLNTLFLGKASHILGGGVDIGAMERERERESERERER